MSTPRCAAFALAFSICLLRADGALSIDYNDNCANQVPTNQGGLWFGACPDPTYGETNWTGNVLPGPGDHAVIDAAFGPIHVNGPAASATVLSVTAMGGLVLDFSADGLMLTSGGSSVNGLVLTNNSEINAGSGVIVSLTGTSTLGADVFGPGIYINNGTANLAFGKLRSGGVLINASSASISENRFNLFDNNTVLSNTGLITIDGTAWGINGSGTLTNSGTITTNRPNTDTFIAPNYTQTGFLVVSSGTLVMQGSTESYDGGTVSVAAGAILEHRAPFGGIQSHEYNGISQVFGAGLVDVYNDFTVQRPVVAACGSGDPETGSGGYRLQSTLTIEKTFTNSGRFRFNNGRVGGFYPFVNEAGAWAYTRSSGFASALTTVTNRGNFQLGGGSLDLGAPNGVFQNFESFFIKAGNITGDGFFFNSALVHMIAPNPATVSTVSSLFRNGVPQAAGTVRVDSGHLQFSNLSSDFQNGDLLGGTWIGNAPGTITFPATVTGIGGGARISGPKSSFPNVDLANLRSASRLDSGDWGWPGDLGVQDPGTLVHIEPPGVDIAGMLANSMGGRIEIDTGATLNAGSVDNGDVNDPPSVLSELASIVVLAKQPPDAARIVAPAVINTSVLNNRGRVLPGDLGTAGTIQLNGDFQQFASGRLQIDIGGPSAGTDHDQLTIVGNAMLDGVIEVGVIGGFAPTIGQQFTVLTTTGTITGAIASVTPFDGNGYSVQTTANTVVLTVTSTTTPTATPPARASILRLAAAYPNPVATTARMMVSGRPGSQVEVDVFDHRGRRIRRARLSLGSNGQGEFLFDGLDHRGRSLPSGVYEVRISSAGTHVARRLTVVR